MEHSNQFASVQRTYGSPSQVEKFASRARSGLLAWEERVAQRHLRPPGKLLDVGCGGGREAIALTQMGYSVAATDISKSLLDAAESQACDMGLGIDFQIGDGTTLDYPESTFHYALIVSQVLGNVPGHAQRVGLLHQARKALKRHGVLVFSVHNLSVCEPLAHAKRLVVQGPEELGIAGDYMLLEEGQQEPCYWHYFTRTELEGMCEEAQFALIECCTADALGQGQDWNTILVCVCRKQ